MFEERILVSGGITFAIGEFDAVTAGNMSESDPDDREANDVWSHIYAEYQEEMIHEVVELAYSGMRPEEFNRAVIDVAHSSALDALDEWRSRLSE